MNKYTFYYVFYGHHSHFEMNAYSTNQYILNKYIDLRIGSYSLSERNDIVIGDITLSGDTESEAESKFIRWYNKTLCPQDSIDRNYSISWFSSDDGRYTCTYTEAEIDYISDAPMDSYYYGRLSDTIQRLHFMLHATKLLSTEYRNDLYPVLLLFEWYSRLVAIFDTIVDEIDVGTRDTEYIEESMIEVVESLRPDVTVQKITKLMQYASTSTDYRPLVDDCIEQIYAIEDLYWVEGDNSIICIETSSPLITK